MQQAGKCPWQRQCPIDSLEMDSEFNSSHPFQTFSYFLEKAFPI